MHLKIKCNVNSIPEIILVQRSGLKIWIFWIFLLPPAIFPLCCFVFEITFPPIAFIVPVVQKYFWSVNLSTCTVLWMAPDRGINNLSDAAFICLPHRLPVRKP